MHIFEIETHRNIKIEMNDDQLMNLVAQRFENIHKNYRIHDGSFQKYYRPLGEIMFDWHDHGEHTTEFAIYQSYIHMIESMNTMLSYKK